MKKPDGKLVRVLRRTIRKWVIEKPTAQRKNEAKEIRFLLAHKNAILVLIKAYRELNKNR